MSFQRYLVMFGRLFALCRSHLAQMLAFGCRGGCQASGQMATSSTHDNMGVGTPGTTWFDFPGTAGGFTYNPMPFCKTIEI